MSKISSISHLKAFLQEHGLEAKKRSSQNFLIDGNIVQKIVQQAAVSAEDLVIEIGPGPGALTEALLSTGCQVWVIEKDQKLASLLRRLCPDEQRFQIFTEDFLSFPLQERLQEHLSNGKRAKVVANLPYHITSPILGKLAPLHAVIESVTVMIQKEVAQRCVAPKGGKDYSSLSLFLQFYSKSRYGFTVEPTCFYPKPSVQSAVVHFALVPPPLVDNEEALFQIIRTAFQQRRKMLRSSLRTFCPSSYIEEALRKQNLDPLSRPEQLSLTEFIALFAELQRFSPHNT